MDEIKIIEKIKTLRKNKDLTLKKIAKKIGLTEGYLSRIENSKTVPPIPTLERIASGLGVSISYLLLEDDRTLPGDYDPNIRIIKKKDNAENISASESGKGYQYESLAVEMPKTTMHPYLIISEFEFGELQQHDGEEFIYVLNGVVVLNMGDDVFNLKPGDSAYYLSTTPHLITAEGGKATILAVLYEG